MSMLRGPVRSKASDEIPSSSMADIAFLLLIFFLVTTVFPKDKGLEIHLPPEGPPVEVPPKNILHILIRPNGVIGLRSGESQDERQVTASEVTAIWRREVLANPNLIAAVRTHPDSPYRLMVDVLDALELADAERVSLQMLEGEGR